MWWVELLEYIASLYVYLTGQALNGWTTLGVLILFIGGISTRRLGIIGDMWVVFLKR